LTVMMMIILILMMRTRMRSSRRGKRGRGKSRWGGRGGESMKLMEVQIRLVITLLILLVMLIVVNLVLPLLLMALMMRTKLMTHSVLAMTDDGNSYAGGPLGARTSASRHGFGPRVYAPPAPPQHQVHDALGGGDGCDERMMRLSLSMRDSSRGRGSEAGDCAGTWSTASTSPAPRDLRPHQLHGPAPATTPAHGTYTRTRNRLMTWEEIAEVDGNSNGDDEVDDDDLEHEKRENKTLL
jgi:hypothetical protein